MKPPIRATRHGEVLLLSLENPSRYPRLECAVLSSLAEKIGAAISDASIHGIVLSGAERAFAAGAQIRNSPSSIPLARVNSQVSANK